MTAYAAAIPRPPRTLTELEQATLLKVTGLLQRWISPDPLAVHAPGQGDLNLYAYVHGRVLVAVDLVGLDKTENLISPDLAAAIPPEVKGEATTPANPVTEAQAANEMNRICRAYPVPPAPPASARLMQVQGGGSGMMPPGVFPNSPLGATGRVIYDNASTIEKVPLVGGVMNLAEGLSAASAGEYKKAAINLGVATLRIGMADGRAEGVMGAIGARAMIPRLTLREPVIGSAGRLRYPNFTWGSAGGALGSTDKFGNITIQAGLTGRVFEETLRHEGVHSVLSPTAGGVVQTARADLGMWAYRNSHLVRYVEEAAAETNGTGSLAQGLKFPLSGYGISPLRLGAESVAYGGIVVGPSVAAYQLGGK